MPTFQLRTPAGNLQASWTSGMRRRLCAPGQHYRTRNTLKALFVNRRSFKPKSQLLRSILILDEKSVIRHLAVSSLPMDDLMESVRWKPIYDSNVLIDWEPQKIWLVFFLLFPSLTLNLLRETGPVTLGEQVGGEKVINQTSTFNNIS